MGDLSAHFDTSEFACQDACGFGNHVEDVSALLLMRLEKMRSDPDVGPMRITSGCRCAAHNAAIGGSANSAHTLGLAADIACVDSARAFRLVKAAYTAGFLRIGIERGCIHVDASTRPEHPQNVLFGWDRLEHVGG
jgi:Peptidase M15